MMRYLSVEDILYIHDVLVLVFENDGDPISPAGARDEGRLVESAANRPSTALGSVEKYRTVVAKAAALTREIMTDDDCHRLQGTRACRLNHRRHLSRSGKLPSTKARVWVRSVLAYAAVVCTDACPSNCCATGSGTA